VGIVDADQWRLRREGVGQQFELLLECGRLALVLA
jgi:hypothetical protein